MKSANLAEALPKDEPTLRFGRFELDPRRGTLHAGGREISLRPKTFALLLHLASRPGQLIAKSDLMDAVWPGVVVGDDSLTQCVGELRSALGEPGLVKTVPRRGYRLDLPESAAINMEGDRAPRRDRHPAALAAAVVLPLVLLGAVIWWRSTAPPVHLDQAIAAQRAIAILPFKDVGDAPSSGYAAAVTEDVAIAVARLPDVLVFAPNSIAAAVSAEGDAMTAAHALGATHFLTGSAERRGNTTLIRAELHRVGDGALLWSERFEYPGAAPWTWQRDATQRIAQSLDVRLRDVPHAAAGPRPHDAVAAVQKGIQLVIRAHSLDDVLRARALLESALATDPDSVVALTFWAFTHTQPVMRRWSEYSQRENLAAAKALDRALALQPDYWPAHFHRSFVLYLDGDVDAAARECEAVLALWPNEPHALQRLGFYRLLQGRVDEVSAPVKLAMRLNPLEPTQVASGHFYLGMALFHQHRDEEAYDELRQATAANPALALPRLWMASIDALAGRDTAARDNLQAFLKILPDTRAEKLLLRDVSTSAAYVAGQQRFYAGARRAGLPA